MGSPKTLDTVKGSRKDGQTYVLAKASYSCSFKMSSRKTAGRRGTTKKRAQRATSNVFAMFNQDQIQEFKEAFNMIDQNRDGFIDKEDLHDMLASLGKDPTDEYLDAMMNEAPGAINFTMFLTLFGKMLSRTLLVVLMTKIMVLYTKTVYVNCLQQWVTGSQTKMSMKCIGKLPSKMACLTTLILRGF